MDNNGYNSAGTGSANNLNWSGLILAEGGERAWSPHPSEVYGGSTEIDADGITVKNGHIRIQNNEGTDVLVGDSTGN